MTTVIRLVALPQVLQDNGTADQIQQNPRVAENPCIPKQGCSVTNCCEAYASVVDV